MAHEPNDASRWRRQIAERVGRVYAENTGVACVLLGGSTAIGHADRFSDIEIGVFWHKGPSDADRRDAAKRTAEQSRLYPYEPSEEVWADDLILGRADPGDPNSGVLVEVVHATVETVERTLTAVLKEYNPDLGKQNLLSGIACGVSIFSDETLAAWQRTLAHYPDGLARVMVERYGIIDHFWRWQMYLERGPNLMLLYQMFSQVEQNILLMLLGLNRVYYSGLKWIDRLVPRLGTAPHHLAERLREPFVLPPAQGAERLAGLVEETFDLIAVGMPEVDTDRLRGFFRYRRVPLGSPPAMLGEG